jgi:hypothetical protein
MCQYRNEVYIDCGCVSGMILYRHCTNPGVAGNCAVQVVGTIYKPGKCTTCR